MLRILQEDPDKTAAAVPFIQAIESDALDAATVLARWKLTLSRLILDCHALITPSTFLVDVDGREARERTAEELATHRCAGLPGKEFAPLSADVRRGVPELSRLF